MTVTGEEPPPPSSPSRDLHGRSVQGVEPGYPEVDGAYDKYLPYTDVEV